MASDRVDLNLIFFLAAISLGSIAFLRWRARPVSALFWLIASLPMGAGTLLGMYRIEHLYYQMALSGLVGPASSFDLVAEGIFIIHNGILLSGALYAINLLLLAWNFVFALTGKAAT